MYKELLGNWKLDPTDIKSQQMYGNTSIEFKSNGELIYTVHLKDKDQMMLMTYEVNDNLLITDQPSSPNKEKTEFKVLPNGKLELFFGGVASIYIKVK